MSDVRGYVVFFFKQGLEMLGDPIRPYLQGAPGNEYVLCREIDTAGALIEMILNGETEDGRTVQLELMVPSSMVRMIVSARGDEDFGFRPRFATGAPVAGLPSLVPTAAPAEAAPSTVPPAAGALAQIPPKP